MLLHTAESTNTELLTVICTTPQALIMTLFKNPKVNYCC